MLAQAQYPVGNMVAPGDTGFLRLRRGNVLRVVQAKCQRIRTSGALLVVVPDEAERSVITVEVAASGWRRDPGGQAYIALPEVDLPAAEDEADG